MEQAYMPLQQMIEALLRGTNAHVCVHDISGVLEGGLLRLDRKYTVHSASLCGRAKMTRQGLRLCMRCKLLANRKAVREGTMFTGTCVNGLTEVALPVVVNGGTACILYVGNLVTDRAQAERRIARTCRATGADCAAVTAALADVEPCGSLAPYVTIAELIRSYILLLLPHAGPPAANRLHWAVQVCRDYADIYYDKPITLREVAQLYFIHEKYIGRLFKKQMGVTFHGYLNRLRLDAAKRLLRETDARVIDVALAAGFETVTYFNRLFKRETGLTPVAFRRKERKE